MASRPATSDAVSEQYVPEGTSEQLGARTATGGEDGVPVWLELGVPVCDKEGVPVCDEEGVPVCDEECVPVWLELGVPVDVSAEVGVMRMHPPTGSNSRPLPTPSIRDPVSE